MSTSDSNKEQVPETVAGPLFIDFHLPAAVDALNAYRLAQHQVAGIIPFVTPPAQAERIINAYQEAAHELANHVSAAVRVQRGEHCFSMKSSGGRLNEQS